MVKGGLTTSYRQFLRRLKATDSDLRRAATEGAKAALQAGLYNREIEGYERGDVFGFDHTEIPVFTWTPGEPKPRKMWISIMCDWATALIFRPVFTEGRGVRGDPNTLSIVALVGGVLIGQECEGAIVGGVPGLMVFDNALAHVAEAVQQGFVSVPVRTHAIRKGSPWENGATESAVNAVEKLVWKKLPGYAHHLKTRYARFPWAPEELLSPDELIAHTMVGIEEMNRSRLLERHKGRSPLEVWLASPGAAEFADPDLVRHSFLSPTKTGYKVQKWGVTFRGNWYQDGALKGRVGSTVGLRYLPHDPSFVDLYDGSQFICSARVSEARTYEQRSELARVRRSQIAKADRIIKTAAKQRSIEAFRAQERFDIAAGGAEAQDPDRGLKDYLDAAEERFGSA